MARLAKGFTLIEDQPTTSPRQVFVFFFAMIIIYVVFSYFKVSSTNFTEFMDLAFLLGGTAALIFSFANLEQAAVGLIFVLPIVNVSLPGMPFYFTYGDAYLLVLSFAWLMRIVVKKEEPLKGSYLNLPIFCYLLLSLFSLVGTSVLEEGIKELVQTMEFFVFSYFIYLSIIRKKESLDTLMLQLALSSILFSTYGMIQYIQMGGGENRAQSTFAHFNAFGCYLAFLVPIFFNMMMSETVRWRKWLFIVAFVTNIGGVLVTFSRGAWIGVMVGIIFSGQMRGMHQFIRVALVVTVLALTASILLPQRFIGRAASITHFADESTQSRFEQYRMAEEIIKEDPFLGVGIGELPFYAEHRGTSHIGEIHNLFLYVSAERGIPALLVLMWLFASYFRKVYLRMQATKYRYFKTFYIANMAAMVSFLTVNFTAYHIVRGIGILLGIMLGTAMAAMRIEDEMEESGEMDHDFDESVIRREPSMLHHLPKGVM